MAMKRRTIVARMVEMSGRTAEDISIAIEEDQSYVSRIISGDVKKVTPNKLSLIAKQCGYELAFIGHDETLVLASVDVPREYRDFEGVDEVGENEFSGKEVAVTGALYAYKPDAQKALLDAVGATWVKRVRKTKTDILIVGSDIEDGHITTQMDTVINGGSRCITKMMSAEDFRQRYLVVTGRDIAVE